MMQNLKEIFKQSVTFLKTTPSKNDVVVSFLVGKKRTYMLTRGPEESSDSTSGVVVYDMITKKILLDTPIAYVFDVDFKTAKAQKLRELEE